MPDPFSTRLDLALDAGLALPPGRIAVLRPRAGMDLGALPKPAVHVIQGFKPDHDAFAAQGYAVGTAPDGAYAAALVCLPRAKAEARALIARAASLVPQGAPILVDGAKTDGADALLREARRRLGREAGPGPAPVLGVVSKAHGKAFWMPSPGPGAFADWAEAAQGPEGFATAPAAFSARGVDRGSKLLAEALPARLAPRVADLGAGWGYLSARALTRDGVEEIHLIEAEHDALEAARANLADPRARFYWADATVFEPAQPFDLVLANPPFHRGREADPSLGRAFLAGAARMLTPRGALWCVANRHLPYERALTELFVEHREVAGDAAYKVLMAARPLAALSPGARARAERDGPARPRPPRDRTARA